MTPLIGVFGAGGCGRGIMPLVRAQHRGLSPGRLVFVDDTPHARVVNGQETVSLDAFCQVDAGSRQMVVAISDPATRKRVVERCEDAAIGFFQARAANVVEMDAVDIGEGAMLSPFVTLTSNVSIGRHFHANLYSYVEHDCVIGDFVTFAPGVMCNGNVHIGNGAYIGAGAKIRQGAPGRPLVIGANAVVGMGAVVTKDVAPGETVIGNPARPLARR